MSDEMTTKYQQHYNQILSGTLTDSIMKSISYQANIKLANEIIAEQEKTITDLKDKSENIKTEYENKISELGTELLSLKTGKVTSENNRISTLENSLKIQSETINKLQDELGVSKKIKIEYENLKGQLNHLDTFKSELTKAREEKAELENHYEKQILDLKDKIEFLQLTPAPAKRKKISVLNTNSDENTILSSVNSVKDGGSF